MGTDRYFAVILIVISLVLKSIDGLPTKHLTQGIGGKILEYIRNTNWIAEEAEGKISGNMSVVLKYNLPIDLEFTLKNKRDCLSIKRMYDVHPSGVYTISHDGITEIKTYCDMDTAGGGWTVFQRRQDGTVDFYRTWQEYKTGFGDPEGEYWLGNDNLYQLTNGKGTCDLYISMENWNKVVGYTRYSNFSIDDEANAYRLHIGNYSGSAGKDSLRYHDNMKFTTKDRDNDNHATNCATSNDYGAWWYNACDWCGLNGLYNDTNSDKGIEWDGFPGGNVHMKFTKMMARCE